MSAEFLLACPLLPDEDAVRSMVSQIHPAARWWMLGWASSQYVFDQIYHGRKFDRQIHWVKYADGG